MENVSVALEVPLSVVQAQFKCKKKKKKKKKTIKKWHNKNASPTP